MASASSRRITRPGCRGFFVRDPCMSSGTASRVGDRAVCCAAGCAGSSVASGQLGDFSYNSRFCFVRAQCARLFPGAQTCALFPSVGIRRSLGISSLCT
jgi:hypothetical protein